MIERLVAPGSISKLVMHRCALGKDTLHLFPIGRSSLFVVVAHPDVKLADRTQKKYYALVVVRQTQNSCSYEQVLLTFSLYICIYYFFGLTQDVFRT